MQNNTNLLQITYILIKDLKARSDNPRIHNKKQIRQIAESIRVFGFNVPILIDSDHKIIAGHGRVLAAKELGLTEVPVILLEHLSDAQQRAYVIADNKLTENASWNDQLLAEQFEILSKLEIDFSLEVTGFNMGEIDLLIEEISIVDDSRTNEIPEITNTKAISKLGDLWLLGNHRLLCGNALKETDFNILMDGKKAQLVFIDPPYNVPIDGHVGGLGAVKHREFVMASGEMTSGQFTEFLQTAFLRLSENSVSGSIHYICMDWRHMREVQDAGKNIYQELKNLCVWKKDNGGMGSFYRSQHELVFVFKHGKAPHKNHFELGQWGRYRTNVWEYSGSNTFGRATDEGNLLALHPTVKPVAMIADAIKDCSDRNDIILDSFLGSGSTLIAAESAGRCCYGMEIDPLYVDTIIRRWEKFTGLKAVNALTKQCFMEQPSLEEASHV